MRGHKGATIPSSPMLVVHLPPRPTPCIQSRCAHPHPRTSPAQDHGPALDEFMEWCDTSCLELNVTKTKAMMVFSSKLQESRLTSAPTFIHGEPVEVVKQYKYLGTL
ncbi:hypothetical protein AAFF_G00021550 [Aldrovandia affinis]|uniref:Uncharacterized protein n=1 Tax=Aldrovandia affinis TaxID=143900 RepID=A0AAD7S5G1_9TELE|nr:hypothetical protein AAFF_G00021550 [Aldrovandia affinis]